MILPPNAVFDLYRPVQVDEDGDDMDLNAPPPLYTGIRAVLSYKTRMVQDPVTRTPRQMTYYFCLLPQGTDVRNDDRLRERTTGQTFNISGVTPLPSYGFPHDVSVSLSLVAG